MFKTIVKRRRLGSRRARAQRRQSYSRRLAVESLEPRQMLSGTWTAVTHAAPSGIGTMELLSDGSVLATTSTTATYRLTPDATGSYANGTWSQLANMNLARLYDATNVLPDGRVFVVGGEYSGPNLPANWTNTGEIYDPVANTWTPIPNFPQSRFGDDPSMLLPDGRVLTGYLHDSETYIYDPAANTWSAGPTKLFNDNSDEETWTKLPDGSILSCVVHGNLQEAQRFDPATMSWIDSGSIPVPLVDSRSEIGGAVLLPDGRVFQIGATSNTALYIPATTPGGTGSWEAGPVIPNGWGAPDGPCAMLPNGHVLMAVGIWSSSGNTTHMFEYDPTAPVASSLTDVTPASPNLSTTVPYVTRMLVLPSGQVLFDDGSSQLYVYTPQGTPQAAWQPTITSVFPNGSNYTLTGTQLNGISAGASYGDDAEMDTNYPIIALKAKDGSGKVYFARTSNWSSTGVATGSLPVTTDFSLPASMPFGTYSLVVVANGIASNPVDFTGGTVGPSSDLAVTYLAPSTGTEGGNIVYNITVTNSGPTNATGVVLTDTLGANLKYVSATKSQGTFAQSGSVITFSFGSIAAGQTATAAVIAQPLEEGNLTNNLSVTSSTPDLNPSNNLALAATVVNEAPINVSGPTSVNGKKVNNQTVATFTHASGIEPANAYVATIDWGDGTTSAGAISLSGTLYSVKGSHTYASSGSHTITTTVVESESGSGALMALAPGSSGTALAATVPQIPSMTLSTEPSLPTSRVAALAREQVFAAFAPDQNDAPLQRALRKADSNTERDDWKLADHSADDPAAADLALTATFASVI